MSAHLFSLDDTLRRATAQELDVIYEPAVELFDTVQVTDSASGAVTLQTVVGFRDGTSWTEPVTTLELANYS